MNELLKSVAARTGWLFICHGSNAEATLLTRGGLTTMSNKVFDVAPLGVS